MSETISLDGRILAGVANDELGEVSGDTRFYFEQHENHVSANYSGGEIIDGYLVGTIDDNKLDIRYVQINEKEETATGHSIGIISELEDGRIRIEDEWEWESKEGTGESVLEEVK